MSANKQWWVAAGALTVMALALAACATAAAPTAAPQTPVIVERTVVVPQTQVVPQTLVVEKTVVVAPSPTPSGPVAIDFWWFGTENQPQDALGGKTIEDWMGAYITKFQADNKNVTINFKVTGAEAGGTTLYLDSALAAGEAPDIIWEWAARLNKYAGLGGLEDVSDVIAARKDDYLPGMLALTTDVSKKYTWGVPTIAVPVPIVINLSAFQKAGCLDKLPQAAVNHDPNGDREWTTDQYLAALTCVNKPPSIYGTFFFAKTTSGDYSNQGYLWGQGAKYFDPPGSCDKTVINSPEGIAGMEFIKKVIDAKLAVPGAAGFTDDDQWAYWQKQQIALDGGYPYFKVLAKTSLDQGLSKPPFEVTYANFPHAPDKPNPPILVQAPETFSLFKKHDPARLAAAKTFLIWLMNQPAFVKEESNVMGEPLTALKSAGSPLSDDPDIVWLLKAIDKNGTIHPGYNCPQYSETRSLWIEAAQAAWSGQKTAKQALDDYTSAVNDILKKP